MKTTSKLSKNNTIYLVIQASTDQDGLYTKAFAFKTLENAETKLSKLYKESNESEEYPEMAKDKKSFKVDNTILYVETKIVETKLNP